MTGAVEKLGPVAREHGLTRERIRQIEAKVLRRLSLPASAKRLRRAFDREIGEVLV